MMYALLIIGVTLLVTGLCVGIMVVRFTPRKPKAERRHEAATSIADAYISHKRRRRS